MAAVARELSADRGILEPLQTAETLVGQVEELLEQLTAQADCPVTLVGHSWGAFLGFIFSARYPHLVKKLVLVSSGPFEAHYASNIMETRLSRLSEADKSELLALLEMFNSPIAVMDAKAFARVGEIIESADAYQALPHTGEVLETRPGQYARVWEEASRLRVSGALLALGQQIVCPVVAIHGDFDPHPAEGVRAPLAGVLKDFRFILLEKCGHNPWIEAQAYEAFYRVLRQELA
jgi:pimeloyl-ACP methyl ester carboxylesterase